MITIWKVAVLASKVCAFVLLLLAIRLILLVGMGVGKKELPGALLDFPPPPPIRDTGPFPLVLKFHKVLTISFDSNLHTCAFSPASSILADIMF